MAEATSLRLRIEAPILLGRRQKCPFSALKQYFVFLELVQHGITAHVFYLHRYGIPTLVFFFFSVDASSLSIVAGQSGCPSQSLQSNISCCRSFFLTICCKFLELLLEQLI
jgi:hypothetical protein